MISLLLSRKPLHTHFRRVGLDNPFYHSISSKKCKCLLRKRLKNESRDWRIHGKLTPASSLKPCFTAHNGALIAFCTVVIYSIYIVTYGDSAMA